MRSAFVLSMCLRKASPRPLPLDAPSMMPGMSAMTKVFSLSSRTPRAGVRVVKG
jgi:hypothetical protein